MLIPTAVLNQIDPIAKVWLTLLFNKVLAFVGPGLLALGISTSAGTPALCAGVVISVVHLLIDALNTKAALKIVPGPAQSVKYALLPPKP
jgi:hypothetical protein